MRDPPHTRRISRQANTKAHLGGDPRAGHGFPPVPAPDLYHAGRRRDHEEHDGDEVHCRELHDDDEAAVLKQPGVVEEQFEAEDEEDDGGDEDDDENVASGGIGAGVDDGEHCEGEGGDDGHHAHLDL